MMCHFLTALSEEQTLKVLHSAEMNQAVTTDVLSHLMILLQAPHTGVLPLSSGACCAACRMELRFCMGVGWTGCWCWVTTVLVLSGRKRSAKPGSVTHGGRLEGPERPAAAAAVFDSGAEERHRDLSLNDSIPQGASFFVISTLSPDVCCPSPVRHMVAADAHVLTFHKNLLAQPLLEAAGLLSMHQQELKLTIWFICCLGLGRWGSWLKAVGRKWLIRKGTHTLVGTKRPL